jgi:nitronate monooxygenase
MLKTRITELFGIERPIVQGGLMWIARAELASAVANAGGIGFMTALTFQEAEDLRAEIRKCREMTDKPFGVNLTFLPSLRTIDYPAYIKICIEEGIQFIRSMPSRIVQIPQSNDLRIRFVDENGGFNERE